MAVLFAAQWGYVGPKVLSAVARGWGVDAVHEPGGEVDPGLLQYKHLITHDNTLEVYREKEEEEFVPGRGYNWRIVHDDQFGDMSLPKPGEKVGAERSPLKENAVTLEDARKNFVRALVGAMYLHCGRAQTQIFFKDHFLSRQLDMKSLFDFKEPTRELSRLCAREGFDSPVARLESETGRLSRHPVFVVGVYSGTHKLGEGSGSSPNEARVRAAAAALRSWYLYSPLNVTLPSSVEAGSKDSKWTPNFIDWGEVVV
jgi:dsRNA-specific ribonuclease